MRGNERLCIAPGVAGACEQATSISDRPEQKRADTRLLGIVKLLIETRYRFPE
jgi:hypothetical protein